MPWPGPHRLRDDVGIGIPWIDLAGKLRVLDEKELQTLMSRTGQLLTPRAKTQRARNDSQYYVALGAWELRPLASQSVKQSPVAAP